MSDLKDARPCPFCGELAESLADILGLIEEGYLVRDVSADAEPSWPTAQIRPVMKMVRAHAAIKAWNGVKD